MYHEQSNRLPADTTQNTPQYFDTVQGDWVTSPDTTINHEYAEDIQRAPGSDRPSIHSFEWDDTVSVFPPSELAFAALGFLRTYQDDMKGTGSRRKDEIGSAEDVLLRMVHTITNGMGTRYPTPKTNAGHRAIQPLTDPAEQLETEGQVAEIRAAAIHALKGIGTDTLRKPRATVLLATSILTHPRFMIPSQSKPVSAGRHAL